MSKYEGRLRNMVYICTLIYIITSIYGFYINYQAQDMNALAMGGVALLTPCIVPMLFKLCKFKPVYEIYLLNIIFVYFASLIGSSFHGYSVPGFDKVLHFTSGLLLSMVAILLFMVVKKVSRVENKEDYHLFLIFINVTNLAIAVCWEFYEYAMLIFFNNDCINHYTSGVHDSMTDMLCAFVGGLIITYLIMRSYKTNKGNFVTNLCEKFYERNVQK